jgi:hypothetical protein
MNVHPQDHSPARFPFSYDVLFEPHFGPVTSRTIVVRTIEYLFYHTYNNILYIYYKVVPGTVQDRCYILYGIRCRGTESERIKDKRHLWLNPRTGTIWACLSLRCMEFVCCHCIFDCSTICMITITYVWQPPLKKILTNNGYPGIHCCMPCGLGVVHLFLI